MITFTSTLAAVTAFLHQGELQPGDEGMWKVWGASPQDITAGDLVGTVDTDDNDSIAWHYVTEVERKPFGFMRCSTPEGYMTYGALCPIVIMRYGNKYTLSPTCR